MWSKTAQQVVNIRNQQVSGPWRCWRFWISDSFLPISSLTKKGKTLADRKWSELINRFHSGLHLSSRCFLLNLQLKITFPIKSEKAPSMTAFFVKLWSPGGHLPIPRKRAAGFFALDMWTMTATTVRRIPSGYLWDTQQVLLSLSDLKAAWARCFSCRHRKSVKWLAQSFSRAKTWCQSNERIRGVNDACEHPDATSKGSL